MENEFCFDLNFGKKLYFLLKRKITWRCKYSRNHLWDETISSRLYDDSNGCPHCKKIKKIRNITQDKIIGEDLINNRYLLQCKKNSNHKYTINANDNTKGIIECEACKKYLRTIRLTYWKENEKML